METRFAQPILGCCVIIELAIVRVRRFLGVEGFQSAIFPKVNFVVPIDRNSARADCLVREALIMKIR